MIYSNSTGYNRITGPIYMAQFTPEKRCFLEDYPVNSSIFLVPFSTAQQFGCETYADVIHMNRWTNQSEYTNHIPRVVVFTSMNGGTPGIGEYLAGSIQVLSSALPSLTLVTPESMDMLVRELQPGCYAQITEDPGPWARLKDSKQLLCYTIIVNLLFGILILVSARGLFRVFTTLSDRWMTGNARFYVYPGIMWISLFNIIMMDIDPFELKESSFSTPIRSLLVLGGYFGMCCTYAVILNSWIKLCGQLNLRIHKGGRFLKSLSIPFRGIAILSLPLYLINIVGAVLRVVPGMPNWIREFNQIMTLILIVVSVLEGIGFMVFGYLMVFTLFQFHNEQHAELRLSRLKTAKKLIMMTTALTTGLYLWGVVLILVFTQQPSIGNFWITRTIQDFGTILSSSALLHVLHQKSFTSEIEALEEEDFKVSSGSVTSKRESKLCTVDVKWDSWSIDSLSSEELTDIACT
ncbi:hypothetical protein K7432_000221 [Basidiobolus ranarum]|uniref:Uncharacterized protein n=1 Tax=Basidiobolus ranarum TaxID=34480 RepID=A0ABR2WBM4_9FUNG